LKILSNQNKSLHIQFPANVPSVFLGINHSKLKIENELIKIGAGLNFFLTKKSMLLLL